MKCSIDLLDYFERALLEDCQNYFTSFNDICKYHSTNGSQSIPLIF